MKIINFLMYILVYVLFAIGTFGVFIGDNGWLEVGYFLLVIMMISILHEKDYSDLKEKMK